jgi:ABC-type branched-subunit amino acid transport system substrate-binding protein
VKDREILVGVQVTRESEYPAITREKGETHDEEENVLKILGHPILAAAFPVGISVVRRGKEIKIGGIMDTTGATSDVGKDYAIGMEEAFKYINDQGGVNGKKDQVHLV